mgnify:CR=1 FL=1
MFIKQNFSIVVWNIETLSSEKSYCPGHSHIVSSVSAQSQQHNMFASTSLDGTCLIWDIRLDKPASLLAENDCGFTASSWIGESIIALGSNNGTISLMDVRMKQELDKNPCSSRSIFKFKYNYELEHLAVCADELNVYVFSIKENKITNM